MTVSSARPYPVDDVLCGFRELIGPAIPGPVAAVYDMAGSRIDSWSTIQTAWRPGKRATARYRVLATGGTLSGQNDLVATLGWIPDGAATVAGPECEVGVWVVPNDPLLPGLRSALDLRTVCGLLADLGSDEKVTSARLRAYRPGRRAVVEVRAGGSSIFLKIVPVGEVRALHDRHRYLSEHLPVPDSLGLAPDLGLVAMRALPGVDLRSVLRSERTVPGPSAIAALVSGLPEPMDGCKTRTPKGALPSIVHLLKRLVPNESGRLESLAAEIGDETEGETVPVHGDFHEAQILVDRGKPTGLIDVDTFGWGHEGDDAATMLGHLHLLAPGCRSSEKVLDLARILNRHWDGQLDPVDLRLRTAAVVLGLATGPFRVQSPNWMAETRTRLAVAESWVESARRVDERSLIPVSGGSHSGFRS